MKSIHFVLILFIVYYCCDSPIAQVDYFKQWPSFRGPFASGIMDNADLPDHWNIKTGENIQWKTEIPGLGHSSPVIWEDKMFITTAISGSGSDSLKVGLYGDIDEVDCVANTGQFLDIFIGSGHCSAYPYQVKPVFAEEPTELLIGRPEEVNVVEKSFISHFSQCLYYKKRTERRIFCLFILSLKRRIAYNYLHTKITIAP